MLEISVNPRREELVSIVLSQPPFLSLSCMALEDERLSTLARRGDEYGVSMVSLALLLYSVGCDMFHAHLELLPDASRNDRGCQCRLYGHDCYQPLTAFYCIS